MNGTKEIFVCIGALFREPPVDHPLNEQVAEVFKKNKTQFIKDAKEWTKKYASTK